MVAAMGELRKITVQVPESDLAMAQELTGEGVTETVRAALKRLAQVRAQQEARKLRGTFQFTIDLDELREDRKLK
jgi:Arc/MetJ-type ribon-helix-helix transcriptional regulator